MVEAGVFPANTPTSGDPSASGNVLANDSDPDIGDTIIVVGVQSGSVAGHVAGGVGTLIGGVYGTLTLAANGAWTYTLDNTDADTNALARNQATPDVFTYTIAGSAGAKSTTVLTVTVTGGNDMPTAVNLTNATVGRNLPDVTVGVLSALDPDLADTHSSFAASRPECRELRARRKPAQGRVGRLDFAGGTVLQVVVRVTDPHGAFIDRTFAITVEDRDIFTLTTANDTVATPATGAYVVGIGTTLNPGDRLTGNTGRDSLLLYNAGNFRVNQLTTFASFEEIQLISFVGTADLFLRDGVDITINGGGGGKIYRLGTGAETITGGSGSDLFFVSSASRLTVADALNGGPAGDTLLFNLPVSSTFDLRGLNLQSIETLTLNNSGTFIVDQAILASFTSLNGSSTSQLVTNDASLNLSGKNISSIMVTSGNAAGTTFTISNVNNAFQIAGGAGSDTLVATGITFTAEQREQIFALQSIETIVDNAGTHVSPFGPAVPRLTAGNDAIVMPAAGGQVLGSATTLTNGNSLTGNAGHDALLLYGAGNYRLDLVTAFTGFEEIELNHSSTSSTADLFLRNGVDIAVNASGAGSKIYRLGTGAETITGGSGSDLFFIASASRLTVADALNGGPAGDTLSFNLPVSSTFDLRGWTCRASRH